MKTNYATDGCISWWRYPARHCNFLEHKFTATTQVLTRVSQMFDRSCRAVSLLSSIHTRVVTVKYTYMPPPIRVVVCTYYIYSFIVSCVSLSTSYRPMGH